MLRKVRNCLTIEQKEQIIAALENGESSVSLSKKFKVSKSTITGIKKQGAKIKEFSSQSFCVSGKKKNLRYGGFPEMETKLYKWFLRQKEKNNQISGEILKAEAKGLFKDIYGEENQFAASSGWLTKFKSRYNIRLTQIPKKELSEPLATEMDWSGDLSVTPFAQPAQQNNTMQTKLHYSNYFLENIFGQSDRCIRNFLHAITLRQATNFVMNAWQNGIEDTAVKDRWYFDSVTDEVNLPRLQKITKLVDDSRLLVPMVTNVVDPSLQQLKNDTFLKSEATDDNLAQTHTLRKKVPLHDALQALSKVLSWALENECTYVEIKMLRKLRERAMSRHELIQQTKVVD